MAESQDLTRWNRAGRTRFDYMDGNAATYLEFLRSRLAELFPEWEALQASVPEGEDEADRVARLEAQYAGSRDDLMWAILRTFSRSAHILSEYMNAYANEGYLGTATQWENVRRLVGMLDYHPAPPASAYTSLVLNAKEDGSGTVDAGFQVKYSPPDGGDPVIFETLSDIDVDPELNALRPDGYDRNPDSLSGSTLVFEEKVEGLKTGEPVVLENEKDGSLKAYFIQGVSEGEDGTSITVSPSLPTAYLKGYTLVHVVPKDKLAPIGPNATGADIGRSLQLSGSASDLEAGEIVIVASAAKKPYFRRIRYVEETRLVFTEDLGELDLVGAAVSRPVDLAVAWHGRREIVRDATLDIVYVAGDWTRLVGQWVADQRFASGKKYLPAYLVTSAKYVPAMAEEDKAEADDKPGFTALTLRWSADEDGVEADLDFSLSNPQSLLVPPVSAGPWKADTFLQKTDKGRLPSTVVTAQPKKTVAGDIAVVAQGGQAAWARLKSVEVDLEKEEARLRAEDAWEDRGGGPYYLSRTTVYSHFKTRARLKDWDVNETPLSGKLVPIETVPSSLAKGRVVIVTGGDSVLKTAVAEIVSGDSGGAVLESDLPSGCTYGNLVLAANVVEAGHGETRSEKVLGSGDATRLNQSFTLEVDGVSFVPDSDQASGVRADIKVKVESRIWEQTANLKDSGPTDAHYTVRMTEEGHLEIGFGDGENGRRLPTATNNVRVTCRQGTGVSGNLAAGSLIKAAKPHRLIDTVEQPMAASGGADMEGVAAMRSGAAATVLTLERAVSLSDFAALLRGNSSVAQARAFSLPTGYAQRESVEVVVIPAGGAEFTADLKAALEEYATAAAAPGIRVLVGPYEPVTVSFTIVLRVRTAEYDPDEVSAQVDSLLKAAFSLENRELGQSLFRGELFQVVEAVEGVENSDCRIGFDPAGQSLALQPTVVKGTDGVIRMIRPEDRQCIHLDPDNPAVDIKVEEYGL